MRLAFLITITVYISVSATLYFLSLSTQSSLPYMTTASTTLILTLIPISFTLSRHASREMLKGVFRPIVILALAYLAHVIFMLEFGIPWEKAAVAYLVMFTALLVDKVKPSTIGLTLDRPRFHVALGFILSAAFMAASYTGGYILVGLLGRSIQYSLNLMVWGSTLWYSIFTASTAFSEETLFRGYILTSLKESLGRDRALTLSSLLFGLWHTALPIAIHKAEIFTSTGLAEIAFQTTIHGVWAMPVGALYLKTRSLTGPIIFHYTWNLLVATITFPLITSISAFSLTLSYGIAGLAIYILVERLL